MSQPVSKLYELLNNLKAKESISSELSIAKIVLSQVETTFESQLQAFDTEHKDAFIHARIGMPPKKPSRVVLLLQKGKYTNLAEEYQKKYALVEKDYFLANKEKREELREADQIALAKEKEKARERVQTLEAELAELEPLIAADDTVIDTYKRVPIIALFITYFETGRVDTVKEAINLMFDERRKDEEAQKAEKYRAEMLDLEKKRLAAEKERLEQEKRRAEAAEDAADYAMLAAIEAHKNNRDQD